MHNTCGHQTHTSTRQSTHASPCHRCRLCHAHHKLTPFTAHHVCTHTHITIQPISTFMSPQMCTKQPHTHTHTPQAYYTQFQILNKVQTQHYILQTYQNIHICHRLTTYIHICHKPCHHMLKHTGTSHLILPQIHTHPSHAPDSTACTSHTHKHKYTHHACSDTPCAVLSAPRSLPTRRR